MTDIIKMRKTQKHVLDFSKPEDIKILRRELKLTANKFGELLGLKTEKDNHGRTVRTWEAGKIKPSGPVRLLMTYLSQGLPIGQPNFYKTFPPFVIGEENKDGHEVIVGLHYPRFIGVISKEIGGIICREIVHGEYLNVVQIIDPSDDETLNGTINAAVLFANNFTKESMDLI